MESLMHTRQEVELAIKQLPEQEARDLAKWLQEYLDEKWDQQIEADVAAGKLDHLIAQAQADIKNGNLRDIR
jgi:predicted amidophosphoribosyltransferase